MENILEIKELTKKYPSFTLDKVSFTVASGRIMGFIGRNGAGKTTTLKCLLNFVHKDAGEIFFFGKEFSNNEESAKQRIGFVIGGIDYYMNKKLKNISKVTSLFYKTWDNGEYQKYLKMFNLDENKTPAELSAGMKVKYSLALALSHNADLLILDEPTSGLDPVSRDDLLDVFLSLADEGKTILFSTHITSDLDKCADDITYIHNGKILASEEMKSFVNKYVIATIDDTKIAPDLEKEIIGKRRIKEGYSIMLKRNSSYAKEMNAKDANLEDIMVHLEKVE